MSGREGILRDKVEREGDKTEIESESERGRERGLVSYEDIFSNL